MNRSEELLEEFEAEMKSTRRLLERVPSDQGEWKPHPKSFSLAQLLSWLPAWITNALTKAELDPGRETGAGYNTTEKTETLLDVAIPAIYGPTADEKWF